MLNIKMICSDLDGTILTYSQTQLSDRLLRQIEELNKKGILFVPTSGRQITSMLKLFAPVTNCCRYICSNGAVLCDSSGQVMETEAMPREVAWEIAHDFLNRTDGRGEVNLAGTNCCHLLSKDLGMVDRMRFIGNHYKLIDRPERVTEDVVKVSVFLPDGADRYIDRFQEKWKDYNPAIAGPFWIDTTVASKGSGVKRLCEMLHIDLKDVAAFGDNYNDVSMLDVVGHPYIMTSAAEQLLDRYPSHTACVEDTLDAILRDL